MLAKAQTAKIKQSESLSFNMATPRRSPEPVKLISQVRIPASIWEQIEAQRNNEESTNGLILRLLKLALAAEQNNKQ